MGIGLTILLFLATWLVGTVLYLRITRDHTTFCDELDRQMDKIENDLRVLECSRKPTD